MSSSTSDIPILKPRTVFGLRTDFSENVDCIADDEIVYPVGSVLAVHNLTQNIQKFIMLPQKGLNVSEMHVSPNK